MIIFVFYYHFKGGIMSLSIDEIKILIDNVRLQRFDTFYYYLCQILYTTLSDQSFDWLIEQIYADDISSDIMYNYCNILSRLPQFSDGVPHEFIEKIPVILSDDILPPKFRSIIFHGIIESFPLYREEETYTEMITLCDWMIKNGEKYGVLKYCLCPPEALLNRLLKQRSITELYESGKIVIPGNLHDAILDNTTVASKMFIGFGFNAKNIHLLSRAILNIWKRQGPWNSALFPNTIRHKTVDFYFTNRQFTVFLVVDWKCNNDRKYYVTRIAIAPEEPFLDDDWVIVQ
jgi:hypothetical protein